MLCLHFVRLSPEIRRGCKASCYNAPCSHNVSGRNKIIQHAYCDVTLNKISLEYDAALKTKCLVHEDNMTIIIL